MTIENAVRLVAGSVILISLALTHWLDSRFVWLTLLVGVMLIQSVFTGFCPAQTFFKKLGFKD